MASRKDQKAQNEGKNQREKHKKKKIKRKEKEISEGNRIQQRLYYKRIKQLLKTPVPPLELFYIICGILVLSQHGIFFILEHLRHFFSLNS